MIHYRLLRDNKETGPYSEEEMIAKGFKPYDLLWAEGRSAGWQYPSEIPAFKMHAPVVEEQPYDRFYKKQPPQKLAFEEGYSNRSNVNQQPAKTNENNLPQPARPNYDYNTRTLSGRHIHVTLPSGNSVNLTTLAAKKEIKESKDFTETNNAPANGNAILNGNIKLPVAETNLIIATETATEQKKNGFAEKLSPEKKQPAFLKTVSSPQPVFKTTKEADVLNSVMLVEPVQKNEFRPQPVYQSNNANTFSWWLVLAAVIGVAAMVGLGIMIGLTMNQQKNDINLNEAINNKSKQVPVQAAIKHEENSVPEVSPAPSTIDEALPVSKPVTVKNNELVRNAVQKTTVLPANSRALVNTEKKSLITDKAVIENNKPIQTQEVSIQHIKPLPATVDLPTVQKALSLSLNDFKTGAFGGISGLKCTLYNGSKAPLESVEVEIDYIQANDKVYKTEKVLFKDISAGSQATIDAPTSTRGIKITSRIMKVNPRDPALSNITVRS